MDILQLLQARKDLDENQKSRVRMWLEGPFDDATKQTVRKMIETNDPELLDAFCTTLSFGTGGLRGIMGVGSNRMNEYTVAWTTQGLANYLHTLGFKDTKAVIGYDSRNGSLAFAQTAAQVLAGNGITVYLLKHLRPTPLVSFACRYYKCQTAIMITASHNPPKYNGYKVYWSDGGQVVPPHDIGIINEAKKIQDPAIVKKSPLNAPQIIPVEEEVDAAYLEALDSLYLYKENTPLKIIYSNLHGTGITLVPQALTARGFTDVQFVDEQKTLDGNFPGTPYPNPEEEQAMQAGTNSMISSQADVFIATDPDCDRVGVVVNHRGAPVHLTGNQVACILAKHVCQALTEQRRMPVRPAFVKTIVTTELFRHIVRSYNALCFDVLTGFKYIAQKIHQWEQIPDGYTYVFGGEESDGYLFGSYSRDKDAVISSCLIAEIARHLKKEGKTLVDCLNELYAQFGLFEESLMSLKFEESLSGKEKMQHFMDTMRNNPPKEIAGFSVVAYADLLKLTKKYFNSTIESIDFPQADVLTFELEDGSTIIIRPSGTEPKIKIYLMLRHPLKSTDQQDIDHAKKMLYEKAKNLEKNIF